MPISLNISDSGVATLVLDSPQRLNAYDRADLHSLDEALRRCEQDAEVRCLLVTGRGRAFCAGADLAFIDEIRDLSADQQRDALSLSPGAVLRLARLPCPTVALVHGVAFGGGACLALACDEVAMATSATLGLVFTDLGLPGGDSAATWLVSRRTGTRTAWRLLAQGARLSGDEAVRYGLADLVAAPDEVNQAAYCRAEQYASRSQRALAVTKRQLLRYEEHHGQLESALRAEAEEMLAAFRHPDLAEGLAAVRDGRTPNWGITP